MALAGKNAAEWYKNGRADRPSKSSHLGIYDFFGGVPWQQTPSEAFGNGQPILSTWASSALLALGHSGRFKMAPLYGFKSKYAYCILVITGARCFVGIT